MLVFKQWCVVIQHQVLQPGKSPLFSCPYLCFQLSNIPSLSQRRSLHPQRGLFVNNISCALINRSSIPGSDRNFCLRQATALALEPMQLSTEGIVAGEWMWPPQFHLLPKLRIRLSCFHFVKWRQRQIFLYIRDIKIYCVSGLYFVAPLYLKLHVLRVGRRFT